MNIVLNTKLCEKKYSTGGATSNVHENKDKPIDWVYSLKNVINKRILLSQAYNNSFRFISFNAWNKRVINLIKSGDYIYEDYLICKPYIDYEYTCDINSYSIDREKNDKIALNRMKHMKKYIHDAMVELTKDKKTRFDIKITKSHGICGLKNDPNNKYYKYSYHFVVNSKYRFRNPADARQLVDVIERMKNIDNDVIRYIDKAVYKNNKNSYQKMRCVYSYKNESDKRKLEPIDHDGNIIENIDITDYLISHMSYDNDDSNIVYLKSTDTPIKGKKKHVMTSTNNTDNTGNTDNTNNPNNIDNTSKIQNARKLDKLNSIDIDDVDNVDNIARINEINEKDEVREILHILKKTIKDPYITGSKYDETSGITYYSFDYDHADKCIHGNDHDRINGYVYLSGSVNVYAGCYSATCKKIKSKKIGILNIINDNWDSQKITEFSTNYIPDDEIMEKIRNFIVNDTSKILAIKSNMNTGKTRSVKELLLDYFRIHGDKIRCLAISLRQAYSNDVSNNAYKEFEFTNYLDVKNKVKLNTYNRLILSMESLRKLYRSDVKVYDVIILDECESLLAHFFSSTVKLNHECFERFVTLLRLAKKIICLDADMSIHRSINFLLSITPDVQIFKNNYRAPPRRYKFTNNYQKQYDRIKEDIENGNNVCIVSINKTYGKYLRDKLRIDFPDIADKIQFVFGQCDKQLKQQLKDVNTNWTNLRVLIYNTIIGQGINFYIKDHFHSVYLYIIGDICSAREIRQMVGRIRNPIITDVYALVDKCVNKKTNSFIYSLDYAKMYCIILLEDVHVDKKDIYYKDENGNICIHTEIMDTIWNTLRASYIQERLLNSSNKNIMTMLKILIETNGDIYEEEYDDEIERTELKSELDMIMETKNVTFDEYNKLKKKDSIETTEYDMLKMKKFELRRKQNLSDNAPDEYVNECITAYIKHETIINIVAECHRKQGDGNNIKLNKINDDALTEATITHYTSMYNKTLTALGYKYATGVKKYTADEFNARIKNLNYTDGEILTLNSRGKLEDKFQIVKCVLDRIGICIKSESTRAYRNKKRVTIINYVFWRDKKIYDVIHNIIIRNNDEYDNDFVNMIGYYNTYQEYIIKDTFKQPQNIKSKSMFIRS